MAPMVEQMVGSSNSDSWEGHVYLLRAHGHDGG
jgi:hypothetical protein